MPLKTSFFCGILIIFICSKSFGHKNLKYFYENCDFSSQNNYQLNLTKYSALYDELILSFISEETFKNTKSFALCSYNSTDSDSKVQDVGLETDSINNIIRAGYCIPGYIINTTTGGCTGSYIELNSRTALTYQWSPANHFSNSTIQNTFLLVDSTRTYYLETTNYSNNLVTNPGFELGNTGFITSYTNCDANNCLDPLGDNGYAIGKDASYFHFRFTGKDHTTGVGNFMIVNGARPSLIVWQQTIPVKPLTNYAFGAWISTMISLSTAQIKFSINGVQFGPLFYAPDYINQWEQVFTTWNSGSETSATIKIVDILPVLVGNDFGLDDLFFGEIETCLDSITVTASQNVNLGNDTIITPPDQQIILTSSGGPFEQYRWNTGDITQSISITDPGSYWLTATNPNGCQSVDTINVRNSRTFVVFPDAFTPNDDRCNDVFRPTASNVTSFHMSIYNRWGQFMYETNDIKTGWNGICKSEKCPSGLYVFVASYILHDTFETKTMRGSFTLIR
jgi:gliding motility-associated-like protein